MSFGNRIAEKKIGGTYVTTLNAFGNLGGMWPEMMWIFIGSSGRFVLMAGVGWVYSLVFVYLHKDLLLKMEKKSAKKFKISSYK